MHFTLAHLCSISPGCWHGVALRGALKLSQLCISPLSPQMSKHLAGWGFYQDGRCKIATPVKAGFCKHTICGRCWYASCGMLRTEIASAFYFTGLRLSLPPHCSHTPTPLQESSPFPCSPEWAGQASFQPAMLLVTSSDAASALTSCWTLTSGAEPPRGFVTMLTR